MYDAIAKLANAFYKMATTKDIKTFTGTSALNLGTILKEGLIPKIPEGGNNVKGVYVTNDIESAAYYASGSNRNKDYPVILEIHIFGNKRIKQIQHDDLDKEYLAGGQFAEPDEPMWMENIENFASDVEKIFDSRNPISESIDEATYDLPKLDGWNVYKSILALARQHNLDVNEIKKKINEIIPVGTDYEYFEIMDDGTVKLTAEYYDSLHQMVYPNWIPAKAIKAVWIPENSILPIFKRLASEVKNFGTKPLSGDLGLLSNVLSHAESDAYNASKEELLEIVQRIKDADIHNIINTNDLIEIANNEDYHSFQMVISEIIAGELDHGIVVNEQNWLKFDLEKVGLSLDAVISLYNKE